MADRATTDQIAVIFSGGPVAGGVLRLAEAPALFLADIGPGLPPRVSLMPLYEEVIVTTAQGVRVGGKRPSYRRTDRRDSDGALVYQWEGTDDAPAEIPLTGHDRATLARWWLALNRFQWPADFPMAEPPDGAGLTDKQKFAHPGYKRVWAAINAAIPYPEALAYRPARGAAVLSGGPAAGVEISLGETLPFHLLATVAPDFLEVAAANVGDLRAGRACYDRTERRDARGFAVYEWDGVAAVGPGPDAAKPAESGSWRDRSPML